MCQCLRLVSATMCVPRVTSHHQHSRAPQNIWFSFRAAYLLNFPTTSARCPSMQHISFVVVGECLYRLIRIPFHSSSGGHAGGDTHSKKCTTTVVVARRRRHHHFSFFLKHNITTIIFFNVAKKVGIGNVNSLASSVANRKKGQNRFFMFFVWRRRRRQKQTRSITFIPQED